MVDDKKTIQQAGAIVFKTDGEMPLVLLVRAKKDPAHWIFPKGHIEPGETAEAAAIRELLEEAGVKGTPVCLAGESAFTMNDKTYNVLYFLIRYVSAEHQGEPGRSPRWCRVEEALSLLSFSDSRDLLKRTLPNIH
jgi:mutator protein MutT